MKHFINFYSAHSTDISISYSQKFYKLKRESEKLLADGSTNPSTPTTKAKATKPKSSGKRKKDGTDDANDDVDDSPTKGKKLKKETKPTIVKKEDSDNGDLTDDTESGAKNEAI